MLAYYLQFNCRKDQKSMTHVDQEMNHGQYMGNWTCCLGKEIVPELAPVTLSDS